MEAVKQRVLVVVVSVFAFHLATYTATADGREEARVATDTVPQLNIEQYVGRWYEVR